MNRLHQHARDVARFVGRIIAGGALLFLAAQATAQRLPITYYSTSSALAHYVVNRVVRDSHGFLWFCTRDGVSRFDGREFVNWGVDDGLPVGDVNACGAAGPRGRVRAES